MSGHHVSPGKWRHVWLHFGIMVQTDNSGTEKILMLATLSSGVIAAGARKAGNATSNVLAEVASVVNRTAGNLTSRVQAVAQSTDADDETTYPGLEQLILPQQELR